MKDLKKIIKRFAEINGINEEEANKILEKATNEQEALVIIKEFNRKKIEANLPKLNRAQRRALAKRTGHSTTPEGVAEALAETTEKLNYIDLIQKLRKLNEEKEQENNENQDEGN